MIHHALFVLENFAEASHVQLPVGQELTLNLQLQASGVEASVDVVGGTELTIDTASASMGANVNPREVEGLPINGRRLSQLYLQAPGSVNSGFWRHTLFRPRR